MILRPSVTSPVAREEHESLFIVNSNADSQFSVDAYEPEGRFAFLLRGLRDHRTREQIARAREYAIRNSGDPFQELPLDVFGADAINALSSASSPFSPLIASASEGNFSSTENTERLETAVDRRAQSEPSLLRSNQIEQTAPAESIPLSLPSAAPATSLTSSTIHPAMDLPAATPSPISILVATPDSIPAIASTLAPGAAAGLTGFQETYQDDGDNEAAVDPFSPLPLDVFEGGDSTAPTVLVPSPTTAAPVTVTAPAEAQTRSGGHLAEMEMQERYEALLLESSSEAWRHIDHLSLQIQQLREQFAAEQRRAQSLSLQLEQERDKLLCLVCQERARDVVFLPCTHLCVCSMCAKQIAEEYRQAASRRRRAPAGAELCLCVVCKETVTSTIQIFVP
eukprot:gene28739-34692_t